MNTMHDPNNDATPAENPAIVKPSGRMLRWTARLTSLASLGVQTLFLIGEGFDPMKLQAREWALAVFFPFGLLFGLILGWRREWLGGTITVGSLVGFYAMNLALSGRFPGGAAFAVLTLPGALFLASALASRPRAPGRA